MKFDYSQEDMLLKVYPTITGCFEEGWYIMKKHFLLLVLSVVVVAFIDAPIGYVQFEPEKPLALVVTLAILKIFGFIYWILVVGPFDYSLDWMFLKASRKIEPKFEEIVSGFRNFVNVILARLLTTVIIGFGCLFLLIPGIFLACKLALVPYLIMDKKVDPITAIRLSWYMTNGYFWTILGMGLVSFFLIILGVVLLIVGIFVALTWVNAAFAVLYKAIEELHYEEACGLAGVDPE